MASLKLPLDAAFWDLNVATPQTLDGTARSVPGEAFPLDGGRASRVIRAQQLSFLGNGFPLGIIPSYTPTSQKELGYFSIQSLMFTPSTSNWWLGLIGQFRPKKLISSLKAEVEALPPFEEWEPSTFTDVARHFVDKSLYSLGVCTQFSLDKATSLLLSTEGHGDRKGIRSKAVVFHKLPNHDLTMEAAWPELFLDQKGRYWDVPGSISLDLASLESDSGLRYRVGIHKNSGHPQALSATSDEPPLALLPGLCAKAAFSYEKSRDFWRQTESKEFIKRKKEIGASYCPSYDEQLSEPHAAISGIIGGTCAAWVGGKQRSVSEDSGTQLGEKEAVVLSSRKRSALNADLFGSVCCTYQHGKFEELYGDLTRVDARLDISSASAFAKGAANAFGSSSKGEVNPLAPPRLNVILQQQVAGPIMFRVDSRLSLGSTSSEKRGPHIEDVRYSLSYSLRLLHSGKVVAWYSPKRKEGMIELRVFDV